MSDPTGSWAAAAPAPVLVRALLARLRADGGPGRPAVTWYGADGERVELSARVLENWVAKTANLLLEELDAGTGTRVHLALPPHWRSVVWRLAVAAVGAEAVPSAEGADVVVTADGDPAAPAAAAAAGPGAAHVVVALPALAFGAADVPAGALDYGAEVAGYGDDLPPVAGSPLLVAAGAAPVRALLPAGAPGALDGAVAALAAGGSVVLLGPGAPEADHVAAVEGATPV